MYLYACIICVCVPSHVWLFVTPRTVAYQGSLSMEFSRQEYWDGLPFPSPGNLPNPGIEPVSLALQADSLRTELGGKPTEVDGDSATHWVVGKGEGEASQEKGMRLLREFFCATKGLISRVCSGNLFCITNHPRNWWHETVPIILLLVVVFFRVLA